MTKILITPEQGDVFSLFRRVCLGAKERYESVLQSHDKLEFWRRLNSSLSGVSQKKSLQICQLRQNFTEFLLLVLEM